MSYVRSPWPGVFASPAAFAVAVTPAAAQKKPNVVMLMTDDTDASHRDWAADIDRGEPVFENSSPPCIIGFRLCRK